MLKQKISLSITFSFLATSSLYALDNNQAQQSLINTIKNKQLSIRNIKGKKINGKRVIINSDGARVMVRLKRGVSPTSAYESLFKGKSRISKNDVEYVKSFPLAERKISTLKTENKESLNKNQQKHILVLKSKTLSDKELLDIAKQIKDIEIAEISKPVSINSQAFPNDQYMSELWGMHNDGTYGAVDADIDAPEAWSHHIGNKLPVVGVIDTGVDYYHPDLKDNIWINEAELYGSDGVDDDGNGYTDDIFGIDVYNYDTDPMDDAGHGTHVSGTIGGEGNNTIGVAGVNWNTRIAACKFLSADGYGSLDGAVECINYFNTLKLNGVNIVATNNSWGGGGYSQILEDAIEDANALGILFVAAAGNDENDNDTNPSYPASYDLPNVISVAATNSNDELAYFSNYGANSVDLAAPGEDIMSTLPSTYMCQQNGNSVLFQDGFESGDGNWSMLTIDPDAPFQDFVNEHWKIDNSMAYNGSNSLSDSLDNNYSNNRLQTAMMKNMLDLSNVDSNEVLCASVHLKGKVETHYDWFQFIASSDGGQTWVYLGDRIDGEFADWTEIGVPIPSDMFTPNFKLALIRYSDCCIYFEGYNIDDVTIGSGDMVQIPHYGSYSGTSMATPHVTGAIAYLASLYPEYPSLVLKNMILSKVDILSSLSGLVATNGRLNINNLVSDYNKSKDLIDFDDIDTADDDDGYDYLTTIVDYKGLTWGNFEIANTRIIKNIYGNNGYYNGTVSANNVAYNSWANDANISSVKPFNFKSAYLTAAWNSDLNITVKGYKDNTLKYTKSVIVGQLHPTKIDFDFDDIDLVVFHSEGGTQGIYKTKSTTENKNSSLVNISTNDIHAQGAGEHFAMDNVVIERQEDNGDSQDINGDGFDDIIVQNTSNGRVNAWLGSASGTVTNQYLKTLSSDIAMLKIADINGDGFDDIIVQNMSNGRVNAWLGSASGTVTNQYLKTLSSDVAIVVTADINGDGFDDIIVQNTSNGRVNAWLGSASGTVTNQYLKTLSSDVVIIDTADINGDGFDDIIVQNMSNGRVNAWLSNASGTVTNKYLKTLSSDVVIIKIADINGDEFDDIIVRNTSNGRVNAWLSNSSATVTNQYLKTLSSDIIVVDTADINGDGFDDIIVQNTSNGRVNAWLGSASGTVTNQYLKTLPSDVEIADITDINGDEFDDIIVQNTSNGRVNAWLGSATGTVTNQYLKTLSSDVEIVIFP